MRHESSIWCRHGGRAVSEGEDWDLWRVHGRHGGTNLDLYILALAVSNTCTYGALHADMLH